MGTEGSFPIRVKRTKREADHTSFTAEGGNAWNFHSHIPCTPSQHCIIIIIIIIIIILLGNKRYEFKAAYGS